MAMTYRPVDRDQAFLLPPSMTDWLGDDHVVWFLIAAVERLDTRRFRRLARLGGVGRRGYDPDMLLTLFVYAMAHGVSSSRKMERLCHTDVAFRVICAQDVPDHSVLAEFRRKHRQALCDLLTETLVLAAALGMVSLGTVGLDGTKIAANASRDANRSEAHLRRQTEEFIDAVQVADEAEDEAYGAGNRGDQMPASVADRSRRAERIAEALEQIAQRRRAAEKSSAAQAGRARGYERAAEAGARDGGSAPTGRPPASADAVAVARSRWERARARAQARYDQIQARRQGKQHAGMPPTPPDEQSVVRRAYAAYQAAQADADQAADDAAADDDDAAGPSVAGNQTERYQANLTDPDSRLLKTRNGWIQGYNCQTAVSDDEFIISARATQHANDVEQFVPTMNDITTTTDEIARRTGRDDLTVGTVLADAGYDSQDNLTAPGPDRLIPDSKRHIVDQRATTDPATGDPPEGATTREMINHRLRTPEGHALYKRRAPIVETPNAWLKDRRGLRQFACRGLAAAQAEFSLASAVTNLLKLATKGITTAQLKAG